MPRDAVFRTAHVGTVGINGLRNFMHEYETLLVQIICIRSEQIIPPKYCPSQESEAPIDNILMHWKAHRMRIIGIVL